MRLEEINSTFLAYAENTWVHDIPFIFVPSEIIAGFRGNAFDALEFYASDIWKDPSHWNAGFVKNNKIVIWMYGHIQRLEKYLYVERIGATKNFQSYGNMIWELSISEADRIARKNNCRYIWTTTARKGEVKKYFETKAGEGAVLNPPTNMVIRKDFK